MSNFEEKYGIEENDNVKKLHRNRRMFCIYKNKLHIAGPNLEYTHAVLFEKEGWMTKDNDNLMNEMIRGCVHPDGDVSIYYGYEMTINDEMEKIFFPYLKELVNTLNLDIEANFFGGWIKAEPGAKWPPIRSYGKIKDNIK